MANYLLKDITIGKINNANSTSKYYVSGRLRNMKYRHAKATRIVIFDTDDQEFVDAVRSVFPKNDKADANAPKYYGTNGDIKPSEFDADARTAAMAKLRHWGEDDEDLLLYENGASERYILPTPMVMKYRGSIGGHSEGEWVCKPGSKFLKIWYEISVFVEKDDDGGYVEGFSPEEMAQNRIRTMIPLMEAMKDKSIEFDPLDIALINSKYHIGIEGGSYIIPSEDELEPPTQPVDNNVNDDDDEQSLPLSALRSWERILTCVYCGLG